MQYAWILDVLTDLRAFAVQNGLPALAEQLDDTSLLAAAEIAQISGGAGSGEYRGHAEHPRQVHLRIAASELP